MFWASSLGLILVVAGVVLRVLILEVHLFVFELNVSTVRKLRLLRVALCEH